MALVSLKTVAYYQSNSKPYLPLSAFCKSYRLLSKEVTVEKQIRYSASSSSKGIYTRSYSEFPIPQRTQRGGSCLFRLKKSVFHHTEPIHRWYCSKPEKSLLSLCPTEFVDFLKSNKINRCYFAWDDSQNKVVASHSELKEIEDWLNETNNPYYQQHEAVFLSVGMRTDCLLGAFLWKVNRGQACGGIRMTPFTSIEHYLGEGLRLSRRLGVKAALSGLWVSGGKGLIFEPKDRQHIQPDFRQKIFYDYGDFVSSLNGCFIAGMDTGVNAFDLFNIHTHTRWVVSGPEDIGGSGNAAALLGRGLLCAMEAALNFLGAGDISGMKVAVQGAGGIAKR